MLGKLLRYEFKASSRILLPLYAAALLLSLISGFTFNSGNSLLMGLMIFALSCLGLSVAVVTIVLIIERFWKNLLKDEGVLMFTLPVSTYEIVGSKAAASLCWILLGTVVGMVSIMVWFIPSNSASLLDFFRMVAENFPRFLEEFAKRGLSGNFFLLQLFVLSIVGISEQILCLYAAMSFSQIFNKRRALAAAAGFLAVNYLREKAAGLAGNLLFPYITASGITDTPSNFSLSAFSFVFQSFSEANVTGQLNFLIITGLVFSGLYFWLASWLLRNRLNLQ